VLYDSTGPWGWLGEIYATMAGNLASHFGTWVAMPVASYAAGTLQQYSALYLHRLNLWRAVTGGIPNGRLRRKTTNVIWIYDNIWQLTSSQPHLRSGMAFMPSVLDVSPVGTVIYKSQSLKR